MTQKYQVKVSMKQAAIVETGIVLKQGDFGMQIEIEVLDFDATGTTPQIVFRKAMGAVESTTITVSSNKYTYTFKGTELDTPGKVFCDLKLKNSTTQRISTASFMFRVIADTMDGLNEQASSYSDTIAQIVGGFDEEVGDLEKGLAFPRSRKIYIEQGNISVTTGEKIPDPTWCRVKIVDKDAIIKSNTNLRMRIFAYNLDDEYIGAWNGTEFVTVNSGIATVYDFSASSWINKFPGYTFSLAFYKGGTLTPETVYSELSISDFDGYITKERETLLIRQYKNMLSYPGPRARVRLGNENATFKFKLKSNENLWMAIDVYNDSSYSDISSSTGWIQEEMELALDGTKYVQITFAKGASRDQNITTSDYDNLFIYKYFNNNDVSELNTDVYVQIPFDVGTGTTRTEVKCGQIEGKYIVSSHEDCWHVITLFNDSAYTSIYSDTGWLTGDSKVNFDGSKYVQIKFSKGDSRSTNFINDDRSKINIQGLTKHVLGQKIENINSYLQRMHNEVVFDKYIGNTRSYTWVGNKINSFILVAANDMYCAVSFYSDSSYKTLVSYTPWIQGTYSFETDGTLYARIGFAKGSSQTGVISASDVDDFKIFSFKKIYSVQDSKEEPTILQPPINSMRSMTRVFNSIKIGEATKIQNTVLYFKQQGDMLANGIGKFDILNGYMYLAQTTHDGPTTAENVYYHNYIRLFKIKMEDMTIENMAIIAEKGGSYLFSDGNTYTYSDDSEIASPYYGIVTCKEGYVYVNHSAPFDGGAKIVRIKIDPSDLSVIQRDKCTCTGPVDYCSNNDPKYMIGIAHQGFVEHNGSYYGGVSKDFKTVGVIKTDDFINFESFYEMPINGRFTPYEEVGIAFDTYHGIDYMYLSVRTQYYEKAFVYIHKIDISAQVIKEIARIADCHSQTTFFWYNDKLYLHSCGPINRDLYCFTEINRESLAASEIIADIDNGGSNANTQIYVDSNLNIYMTMSGNYISKIKLDYFSDADVRSILSSLIPV